MMTSKVDINNYNNNNNNNNLNCDTSSTDIEEDDDVYTFTDTYTFNVARPSLRSKRSAISDEKTTVNWKASCSSSSSSISTSATDSFCLQNNSLLNGQEPSTSSKHRTFEEKDLTNKTADTTITSVSTTSSLNSTEDNTTTTTAAAGGRSKRKRQQYKPYQAIPSKSFHDACSNGGNKSLNGISVATTSASGLASEESMENMIIYPVGDFLAIRNEVNSFFVCRAKQNIRRIARRIRIQWYCNDAEPNVYSPDFLDHIDFETILSNITVLRREKGVVELPKSEHQRVINILQRAINVERGINAPPDPTKVLKDGVDISILGKEEEVLKNFIRDQSPETSPNQDTSKNSLGTKTKEQETTQSNGHNTKTNGRKSLKHKRHDHDDSSLAGELPTKVAKKLRSKKAAEQNGTLTAAATGPKRPGRKPAQVKVKVEVESEEIQLTQQQQDDDNNRKLCKPRPESSTGLKRARKADRRGRWPRKKVNESVLDPNESTSSIIESSFHNNNNNTSTQADATCSSIVNSSQVELPMEMSATSIKDEPLEEYTAVRLLKEFRFVSSFAHSRLLAQVASEGNSTLIEQLLREKPEQFCSPSIRGSISSKDNALRWAIRNEDFNLLMTLVQHNYRGQLLVNLEPMDLHHSQLALDREEYRFRPLDGFLDESYARYALRTNVSIAFILKIQHLFRRKLQAFSDNLKAAAQAGNFELITFFMLDEEDVLECDNLGLVQKPREPFTLTDDNCAKMFAAARLRTIHLAAINPDPSPFVNLLTSRRLDDLYLVDIDGWSPLHYAAVANSSFCLQQLLFRGVPTTLVDRKGNTPLHLAVKYNRYENVHYIINKSPAALSMYNQQGYTPFHLASKVGNIDILKLFLFLEVNIDQTTATNDEMLTPAMIAAQHGHLAALHLLAERGANLNVLDGRQRSVFGHAVLNGHTHVLAYLLEGGETKLATTNDNFGNNLFHYALAYGWYGCYCLLLSKTNVALLQEMNAFGLTPMAAAFCKGHHGLLDEMLEQKMLNVNTPLNATGANLMMLTFTHPADEAMWTKIKLYTDKCDAHFGKTDFAANNVLHHLLLAECRQRETTGHDDESAANNNKAKEIISRTGQLLLRNGCDPFQVNSSKVSPIYFALKNSCFLTFSNMLKAYYKLTKFQQVLTDNEYLWQMIITHHLRVIEVDGETITFGAFVQRIAEQQKSVHSILHASCYKTSKNGDIPIEILFKSAAATDCRLNAPGQTTMMAEERENFLNFMFSFYEAKFLEDIHLLHLAAGHCTTFEFRLLLAKLSSTTATNLDAVNEEGERVLTVALKRNNFEVASVLIEMGASFNYEIGDYSVPVYALKQLSSVKFLVDLFDNGFRQLSLMDSDNNTLLHLICKDVSRPCSLEAAQLVLLHKLPINTANKANETALHVLLQHNRSSAQVHEMLTLLENQGIDPLVKDANGRTALSYIFAPARFTVDEACAVLKQFTTERHNLQHFTDYANRNLMHYAAMAGYTTCCYFLLNFIEANLLDMGNASAMALAVANNRKECAFALVKYDYQLCSHYELYDEGSGRRNNLFKLINKFGWTDLIYEMAEKARNEERLHLLIEALLQSDCIDLAYKVFTHFRNVVYFANNERRFLTLFAEHATTETSLETQRKMLAMFPVKMIGDCLPDLFLAALTGWNYHLANELIRIFSLQRVTLAANMTGRYIASVFVRVAKEKEVAAIALPPPLKTIMESMASLSVPTNILYEYPIFETFDEFYHYSFEPNVNKPEPIAYYSPLIVAIIKGDHRLVRWLLTNQLLRADVNFVDSRRRTPLMHAVLRNDLKMVKLLLNPNYNFEADPNPWHNQSAESVDDNSNIDCDLLLTERDERNKTVFHYAIAFSTNYTFSYAHVIFALLWRMLPPKTQTVLAFDLKPWVRQAGATKIAAIIEGRRGSLKAAVGTKTVDNNNRPTLKRSWSKIFDSLDNRKKNLTNGTNGCLSISQPATCPRLRSNVLMDEATGQPYDVIFTKLSHQNSNYFYNFYKMELTTAGNKFIVSLRFGNVGTFGNVQKKIFDSKVAAIEEFQKIFNEKSTDQWVNIERDENKAQQQQQQHHHQQQQLQQQQQTPASDGKEQLDEMKLVEQCDSSKCDIPLPVQDLLARFLKYDYDKVKMFKDVKHFDLNVNLIINCEAILYKIYKLILFKSSTSERKEQVRCLSNIIDLNEEFYRSIRIFGDHLDRLKPLLEFRDFYKTYEYLHQLKAYIFAKEELAKARMSGTEVNVWNALYDRFSYRIQPIGRESLEMKTVLQYLKWTLGSGYMISSIFAIRTTPATTSGQREEGGGSSSSGNGEHESEEANNNNNNEKGYLLWYNVENYQIIDTFINGINVQPIVTNSHPPQIINGITLQNYISKKAKTTSNEAYHYTMLCEAKLGQVLEVDTTETLTESMIGGKNCILINKHRDQYEAAKNCIQWDGYTIPLAESIATRNRYIVINSSEVVPKYLIEYKL